MQSSASLPLYLVEGQDADDADARLVRRALEGERDAWNALIARHERKVLLTLLARGVRVDRAKDIVQETWTRLIAQQREGRLSWLELPGLAIRQATFLALEDARRRAKHVGLDEAPEIDLLSDPQPSTEERLAARAKLQRAADELGRCPDQARRVFSLVYQEPELPHAEAAARVGLSVQRVRQTLCEVRARLKAAMESSDDVS